MKQKTFFIVFKGLSFGKKNENLIKNNGHKLSCWASVLNFLSKSQKNSCKRVMPAAVIKNGILSHIN